MTDLIPTDLKALAENIRNKLKTADEHKKKADNYKKKSLDHRIEAGHMLIEAKELVQNGDAGKTTWTKILGRWHTDQRYHHVLCPMASGIDTTYPPLNVRSFM